MMKMKNSYTVRVCRHEIRVVYFLYFTCNSSLIFHFLESNNRKSSRDNTQCKIVAFGFFLAFLNFSPEHLIILSWQRFWQTVLFWR